MLTADWRYMTAVCLQFIPALFGSSHPIRHALAIQSSSVIYKVLWHLGSRLLLSLPGENEFGFFAALLRPQKLIISLASSRAPNFRKVCNKHTLAPLFGLRIVKIPPKNWKQWNIPSLYLLSFQRSDVGSKTSKGRGNTGNRWGGCQWWVQEVTPPISLQF